MLNLKEYKITVTLYAGIVVMLFAFYFVLSQSTKLEDDIKSLNKLYTLRGNVVFKKESETLNRVLEDLSQWAKNNNNSFFIAQESLENEFTKFRMCVKTNGLNNHQCSKNLDSLIFGVSRMIVQEEKYLINVVYIGFASGLGVLIVLIFLVRAYMYQVLQKKALMDLTTKLYTRDYLFVTMKELCARYKRTGENLSAMFIEIKYDKNSEKLEKFAQVLLETIRESDIPCRYNDGEFIIIFPNTQEKDIKNVLQRIEETLNTIPIKYNYKILEYNKKDNYELFIDKLIKGR